MNINQILKALQTNYPDWEWNIPPDLNFGILTTNQAFKLVKNQEIKEKYGITATNPKDIAIELAIQVQEFVDSSSLNLIAKAVGSYVNLDLNTDGLSQILNTTEYLSNELLEQSPTKIMVEYIGTNVAKKFHAGHMRNLNIGDSLRRILSLKYPNLITDNHWGDWGVNMGILLWGWKQQANLENYKIDPLGELSRVYVWANNQEALIENFKETVREEFRQLENHEQPNYGLWQEFIEVTKEDCKNDIAMLGVPYTDLEQGESFYEAEVRQLWEFLETHELWQKEGAARYFDFDNLFEGIDIKLELATKFRNFGRCYLVSSQGNTSYAFRDIAARIQWSRDLQITKMITATANEQIHHFNQFFAICHYLSTNPNFQQAYGADVARLLDWNNLIHIAYGFLTLETGKMSSRKGTVLTIRDLFNEVKDEAKNNLLTKSPDLNSNELESKSYKVTLAALKWYDLNRGITENLVLNVQTILQFEGNTGVYQLYTLARINSILTKNQDIISSQNNLDIAKLNSEEVLMLKKIYELPHVLDKICGSYKPHLLCTHLFELATQINSWYAKYSVSGETDIIRKESLLQLCTLIKSHFWFSLDLLGIQPLESL